ncbi:MAG: indolepyruvate oxidoreductase subunit beta [Nitrososphaerales archaeon]
MKECNIVIAGVGGQGILLVAKMLGTAALMEGFNVRVSEIHGMAQRGGTVVCDVRIGEKVYAPTTPIGKADVMLGLEPIETLRHIKLTSPQTLIVMNTRIVEPVAVTMGIAKTPTLDGIVQIIHKFYNRAILIDAMELAIKAGSPLVQNVVMLGALISTEALPFEIDTLKESIRQLVSPKHIKLNIRALELGLKAGGSYSSFRY